jgi:hypothetical protein
MTQCILVVEGQEDLRGVLRDLLTGSGYQVVADLRSLFLPDTAEELCAVATTLKLSPDDILLWAKATEGGIRRLSQDGTLAQYWGALQALGTVRGRG